MEKVPKDVLVLFALEMDLYTLLQICLTNSIINRLICDNDIFWKNKIEKERPGLLPAIYYHLIPISYKNLYRKSLGDNVYHLALPNQQYISIKGDFDEMDFKADVGFEQEGTYWSDNKTSVETWELTSDNPEYTFEEPVYTNTRSELINIVRNELSGLMEANYGDPEYYINQLDETGEMDFDTETGKFYLSIDQVDIY